MSSILFVTIQLVVIPYNTLLHKSTREASNIKLKNNIVVIDEAHNLLDAIGNMHSSHISGSQVFIADYLLVVSNCV